MPPMALRTAEATTSPPTAIPREGETGFEPLQKTMLAVWPLTTFGKLNARWNSQ